MNEWEYKAQRNHAWLVFGFYIIVCIATVFAHWLCIFAILLVPSLFTGKAAEIKAKDTPSAPIVQKNGQVVNPDAPLSRKDRPKPPPPPPKKR